MIWFTSDTHFGHANVLGFTDRPYEDVAQMNHAFVNAINERVLPDDELYILGDFSFKMAAAEAAALRARIRCRKVHLVPGNHDKDWTHKDVAGTFIVEPPIVCLKVDGQKIVLSHYPMMDWQSMAHGSWHLHGHIHSTGSVYNKLNRKQGLLRYDVGVNANGWAPVNLEEIRAWFAGTDFRGRARWWDWVNGTADSEVAQDCAVVRELMDEVDRDRAGGARGARPASLDGDRGESDLRHCGEGFEEDAGVARWSYGVDAWKRRSTRRAPLPAFRFQ